MIFIPYFRQELVFIGTNLVKDQLIKDLEECLLTEEEMIQGTYVCTCVSILLCCVMLCYVVWYNMCIIEL